MKINVITKKFRLTDDLSERIEKKLTKLDRYFAKEIQADVKLYTQKSDEIAEVTIFTEGTNYRGQGRSQEMFTSIDEALVAIEKQIQKHRTRLAKRLKSGAFDDMSAGFGADEEELELVKKKTFAVKPMTTEEAMMQMDLLGHAFFVFRDMESEEIQVIYRRKDGGYGMIVPQ